MREFGNCGTVVTDSKILLKDKKSSSKIVFNNELKKEVIKVVIDGCFIKEGVRCDYLVIDCHDNEYYVELKGSDIKHAVEQIEETIKTVSNDKYKMKKYAFIISTRVGLPDVTIQNFKQLMRKKYKTVLIIHNSFYSVDLT